MTPTPAAFNFEELTRAWLSFASATGIPLDYCGSATAAAHEGAERAQALLRDHIVANNDYRLFALLHLLGNASVRMEQVLDPEGYAEAAARIEAALEEARTHCGHGLTDAELDVEAQAAMSVLPRD